MMNRFHAAWLTVTLESVWCWSHIILSFLKSQSWRVRLCTHSCFLMRDDTSWADFLFELLGVTPAVSIGEFSWSTSALPTTRAQIKVYPAGHHWYNVHRKNRISRCSGPIFFWQTQNWFKTPKSWIHHNIKQDVFIFKRLKRDFVLVFLHQNSKKKKQNQFAY